MSSVSIAGPFGCVDVFYRCAELLEVVDVGRSEQVCRSWNSLLKDALTWKKLSEREGVPLVASPSGHLRNYREDFKILRPITISGKKISQFFGKIVGHIPPISEKWVNKLQEEDPFEKKNLMRDNYLFVVIPSSIRRTVDQEAPLALDEWRNLIESTNQENGHSNSTERRDLEIPFSLKNFKKLCSYPLKGKENMPVFDGCFVPEVFDTCADKTNVYFMRKCLIWQSKNTSYSDQEALVKTQGFEVTPLRERAIFDAIKILESGTCPDVRYPWNFVRSPDTVCYLNGIHRAVIGGFSPCFGMDIYASYGIDAVGVVPGVSAEVLLP
jgi:hypothetical protein